MKLIRAIRPLPGSHERCCTQQERMTSPLRTAYMCASTARRGVQRLGMNFAYNAFIRVPHAIARGHSARPLCAIEPYSPGALPVPAASELTRGARARLFSAPAHHSLQTSPSVARGLHRRSSVRGRRVLARRRIRAPESLEQPLGRPALLWVDLYPASSAFSAPEPHRPHRGSPRGATRTCSMG
jgi:hypothetical protein